MIKAIDHIVLSANDLGKTIWFYCDVLGMELQRFTPPAGGDERLALGFGSNKINLHDVRKPFEPHTRNPTIGSLDICFLSDKPVDQWREHVLSFAAASASASLSVPLGWPARVRTAAKPASVKQRSSTSSSTAK